MAKVSVIIPIYQVESTLESLLSCVAGQSFNDFEVIMINDGSKDGSREIASAFCVQDSRFHLIDQTNQGVSAARNKGLERAKGKYVVFYDGDDFVPKNALKQMVKTAEAADADMVIGILELDHLGIRNITTSKQLARQKDIEPWDEGFIHAWSVCNKLFRRDFLVENGLHFEPMKHSEDAVFTYAALACAKVIAGCRTIAYRYVRRPFWEEDSATQQVTCDMLRDLYSSHDRILEETTKLLARCPDEAKRQAYLSKLYTRFIDAEMTEGFYRHGWQAEEGVLALLRERAAAYGMHIDEEDWGRLVKKQSDLSWHPIYPPLGEDTPKVSLLLAPAYVLDDVKSILDSIYGQRYLHFEVLVAESLAGEIPQEYRACANLHIIPGEEGKEIPALTAAAKAAYVITCEKGLYYTKNTLTNMIRYLDEHEDVPVASVMVRSFADGKYRISPAMDSLYGLKSRPAPLGKVDGLTGNKIHRKNGGAKAGDAASDSVTPDSLAASDSSMPGSLAAPDSVTPGSPAAPDSVTPGSLAAPDLATPCGLIRNGSLLSGLSEGILSRKAGIKTNVAKQAVHGGTEKAISLAKKKFSREDVDRVLKLVKKDTSRIQSG